MIGIPFSRGLPPRGAGESEIGDVLFEFYFEFGLR